MRNNDGMMEVEEPSKCFRFWYYTWKVCTCILSHVTLISLVVAYCVLGAFTFEKLEADNEKYVREQIPYIRGNLTEKLWETTQNSVVLRQDNWTAEVMLELKIFEHNLLQAMKKQGWDGKENVTEALQWTFSGALFYSIIVITTIGYGHIAPKTHWGKVVTIFYAILGIPLMLLCLSNIGDIMAHSFRFIYWKVCCYLCTRKPKRHHRRGRTAQRQGTIRAQSGGGRGSGKSRSASFRRSARASQRSADSALGLSDSLMTRSSYSDTECRYYDDAGLEVVLTGPSGVSSGPGPAAPGIQRLRASSQHSRYSDSTLQVLPPHGGSTNHQNQQQQQQQPPPSPSSPGSGDSPRTGQGPILFNRYAADDSQLPTSNQSGGSWRRGGGGQRSTPGIELDALPAGRGDSVKSTSSLPAPASSGGPAAISRYQRQGSSRLSRLREDEMQDEYLQPYIQYDSEPEWDDTRAKPVPIWLCVLLVVSYIIGGAFLFASWEGWSLLNSAYFCFITLTTIGFGDFVPAQGDKEDANVSIALCSLYLLFGIALLAMSFNLVQEEVINGVKSVARRLGIIKDVEEDEE